MPLDPTIPLGATQPDIAGSIGKWGQLGLLRNQLALSNATLQPSIDTATANARRAGAEANVAEKTQGSQISTAASQADTAQTQARMAAFGLTNAHIDRGFQEAGSLNQDPRIQVLADPMANADPQVAAGNSKLAVQAIMEAKQRAIAAGVPADAAEVTFSPLITAAGHTPQQLPQMVQNIVVAGAARQQQPGVMAPGFSPTASQGGTAFPQTNPYAPGGVTVPGAGRSVLPPNQIVNTPTGAPAVANAATGLAVSLQGVGNNPPLTQLPQGETTETLKHMLDIRSQAMQSAATVGMEHNLNRSVFDLADKTDTGMWGKGLSRFSNITGFNVGGDITANRNTMGKFLARSAAFDAQTMGLPNTNAGAAQAEAASGSTDYDPITLKRISVLKDGMSTGKEMFQKGLESTIQKNGVFAARQFTAQWGSIFDPDAAAFKAAVDSKNTGMQQFIIRENGGPKSPKMRAILDNLKAMRAMAEQ